MFGVSGYFWESFVYVGKDSIETVKEKEFVKKLSKSGEPVPYLKLIICNGMQTARW